MARIDNRIAELERRVKRKLSRIKARGINTGSINPIRNYSGYTTRQKESYANRLAGFIDNPGYVAGEDGTPISRQLVLQIRYAERKTNQYRAKRYGYAEIPPSQQKSLMGDMTLQQFQFMGTRFNPKTRRYEYNSRAGYAGSLPLPPHNIETFHSEKAAREYLERINRIRTPQYQSKQMETLIANIAKRAESMDSEALRAELKSLDPQELDELYSKSDFVQQVFIDSPPRANMEYMGEPIEQAIVIEDQENYLLDLIRRVRRGE